MEPYCYFLALLALTHQSIQLEFSVAYNFVNESGSAGIFQPWMASRTGTLKFNFKTFDSDGLLFYVGDHNDPSKAGNYMYLKLEWGKVVLVTQVHYFTHDHEENKIEERIELGKNQNDGNWHGIGIERKGAITILKVDEESATLHLADRISNLRIASQLYLGGIPKEYFKDGCKSMKQQFPRFLGCIKDLGYGEGTYVSPPHMLKSEYVDQRELCLDACKPADICRNGGVCRNFFLEYKCDCLGTGFEGVHCEKPSLVVTLDGLGYIESVNKTVANGTDIALSFKTRAANGIIFGVGDPLSHLVMELVREKVRISVKLRTGMNQEITVNSQRVNDDKWHFIRVTRREQEVRVILDKRFEESKVLESQDDNNAIVDSVHLGGAWNTAKIFPGFSQTKFCGCLLQVHYNNVDILRYGQYKGSARKTGLCQATQCIKK